MLSYCTKLIMAHKFETPNDFKRRKTRQNGKNIALPLETVTLKMNQKALLVHILLEPGTVEKQCGVYPQGEKLCVRAEKGRYFSYHCCYHQVSAVVSNFCGEWSSTVAFTVNKIHILIFSQYLPHLYYIYRRQSNYSMAENVVFINTCNQVQKKLRA